MDKEQHVTYETARLLKEKGFDWFTFTYYAKDDEDTEPEFGRESLCSDNWNGQPDEVNDLWCSAPTQQMACRWLREEHKMFISIGVGTDIEDVFGYMPEIYFLEELDSDVGMYGPNVDSETICDFTPQNPEGAIEAALKFALTNLI